MRVPSWHDNIRTCTLTFFVPHPLHKLTLTSSFSYFSIWHLSVLKSYHFLSADYLCVQLVHVFFFFLCLHAVEIFPPLPVVSTLYPVLSPSVSTLDSILSPTISILYYIYYWFGLTLTTFTTQCVSYGSSSRTASLIHLRRCSAHTPKRPTERFMQACLTDNATSSVNDT